MLSTANFARRAGTIFHVVKFCFVGSLVVIFPWQDRRPLRSLSIEPLVKKKNKSINPPPSVSNCLQLFLLLFLVGYFFIYFLFVLMVGFWCVKKKSLKTYGGEGINTLVL